MEELQAKWDEILLNVKNEYNIPDIAYKTWIAPLSIYRIEGNIIYIFTAEGSDQLTLNHVKKRYSTFIQVAIAISTGIEYELEFLLPIDNQVDTNKEETPVHINTSNYINSNLNSNYTFENFVVGNNNKFAQNASLAVAESPGDSYNPLFVYGGPGLGKTHLIHAIGNYILKQDPNKSILYVTTETFTNELIDSIRSSNNSSAMSKFREKYRNVDVLMIDDIQFIIGKESTQEEFFNTFNELHSAGKQIIITSDRPPKELETLSERLTTRFLWGVTADIGYPDYETRMAIIRKKVEYSNIIINEEIQNYIAENIKSNIREIEGALNKLIAYSKIEHKEITIDIAKEELQNLIYPDKPKEITPQLVIEVVAEHYQISLDKMISSDRSGSIARPRQIAMYLCKTMTDSPLDSIGQLLGGRDHSTIIHGAKKIEEEYKNNEEFHSQIDIIKKKINPN